MVIDKDSKEYQKSYNGYRRKRNRAKRQKSMQNIK